MFRQMFRWGSVPLLTLLGGLGFMPSTTFGQMVTAGFPLVGARQGFSERFGTHWALRGPGAFNWFNNNSGGGVPPFGGFTPNAGLSGGFGVNAGKFGGRLGFNFAQGSSRSMISNTPVVTGFNGQPMFFQNSVQRPFVTNLIPNVGGGAGFQDLGAANTIRGRMLRGEFTMQNGKVVPAGGSRPAAATNTEPARVASHRPLVDAAPLPRAEREAQQNAALAEQSLAIRDYLRKGQEAEAAGKRNVAKLYYQMAARRAEGELQREALASLNRVAN